MSRVVSAELWRTMRYGEPSGIVAVTRRYAASVVAGQPLGDSALEQKANSTEAIRLDCMK